MSFIRLGGTKLCSDASLGDGFDRGSRHRAAATTWCRDRYRRMPEALIAQHQIGTAKRLRLDLSFSCAEAIGQVESDPITGRPGQASVSDCARLLQAIERWIGLCEAADLTLPNEPRVIDFARVAEHQRIEASSRVVRLHFGSPFLVQISISLGGVPALALLLYGAKRLYGYDLELKNYRENLKIEYLEAAAYRETLENEPPPIVDTALGARQSPSSYGRWTLKGGALSDESE